MTYPRPVPPRKPKKPITLVPSTADMQKILGGGK